MIGKPLELLEPGDIPESYAKVLQAFFPLHAYLFDGAQVGQVEFALRQRENQLVRDCMAKRGWDYTDPPQTQALVEQDMHITYLGSALADEVTRRNVGYGVFLPRLTGAGEELAEPPSELPEEAIEDSNSCVTEAVETIRSNSASWEIFYALEIPGIDEYYEAMLAGRESAALCLVNQGYPRDPSEYFADLDTRRRNANGELQIDAEELAALAEEERAAADAEWECYRQNGLLPFLMYNLAQQTAIVEGYPDMVADMRADLRRGTD
ncbi:MAG: hypothetical protein LBS56_07385 [Propionibacteriaceae bacterium]|nr:hypothetical protein [Propionibacteriaceae bacterium]